MTIIVALRDRIVSDSKLTYGSTSYPVGKIFRRGDGALFATAGDGRVTYHFEKAMKAGREPAPLELLEGEEFEAVLLTPNRRLFLFNEDFAAYEIGGDYVMIGCGRAQGAARSWMLHGAPAELAVERAIEVDAGCGGPVVTVLLDAPSRERPKRR